ncbi:MAG: ABC transporter substrate-binding protein [Syntrophaceae bacterium]|jgi:branched-chain amino acid transport system substrate-binding protein|nr:ABC transporter substrate-binding protein [Syntrophaceae bacterium]HOC61004.1 ABC transporter substrate-binding protein [Smithellaceae bacterium]HQM44262.1 ABC transporter substrate-binding protein [Smithellaceae bacterium]
MKKTIVSIILLVICSLGLCSCGKEDSSQIKVGVIAELTGDIPAVGASCKNAAEMAAAEINDAGGILLGDKKYKVKLIIEDNAGKADQSVSAAQKLITQNKVLAIIGPNASRYALPAAEIAESSKVVLITPWSTAPKTTLDSKTGAPKKFVFRSCFIDPFQGGVLAKFTLNHLNLKKAAVLYDVASEYNKGIAEIFRDVYEKNGGKVVSFETYTTNDKDFSSQLTKIKKAGPEIIFLPNYYSEIPLQIQQAKRLGITVPFIGADAWGSSDLVKLCGADCNDYYFSTHYAADAATDVTKKFIANYKAKYGTTPDDVAALTYDSFGLLWKAIKTAGKNNRQAVRDTLAKIPQHEGVTGNMQFQEGSGDPVKSAVILKIRDGKFTWFANAKP